MPGPPQTKKDFWDKADVVIKGLATALITGAITIYGFSSERQALEISEANRKARVLVETMNNRELSAADMRARMFNTLMTHYFQHPSDSPVSNENWTEETLQQKHTILRLIASNFEDNFSFKPLFEELEEKAESPKQIEQLMKSAKLIAKRQIDAIKGGGGYVCDISIVAGNPVDLGSECGVPLTLRPLKVDADAVRLSTTESGEDEGFKVGYFDMPLLDTSTVGEITYSLVLAKADPEKKTASMKLVILPALIFNSRNRLRTELMLSDLAAPNTVSQRGWCLWGACFYYE